MTRSPSLREVPARPAHARSPPSHAELGQRWLYVDGDAAAAVHRERDEHRSGCSASRTRARPSRTASTTSSSTAAPDAVNRRTRRHQGVRARPGRRFGPAADGGLAAQAVGRGARRRSRLRSPASTRCSPRAFAKRTSSIESITPAVGEPRRGERDAPGARRHVVEQAVLLPGREPLARRARRRAVCRVEQPTSRNSDWAHMVNADVISMPDKWEYPWYAAWDLAFHAMALSTVDIDFAKSQLELMLREMYLHPSGQIPAYEWNFSDVNPPVHAWATIFLHRNEQALHGRGDIDFLKRSFGKLLANFTWWVNRKDRYGKNVFEGGFLGLDNIGVFDRSAPLPTGGYLEQADGTAWMALFCQNMLEIAVEIASEDPTFEDMAVKFVDHFLVDRQRAQPRRARRHVGRRGRLLLRRPAPARTGRPRGSRCDRSSGCCRSARRRSSSRGSASACRRSWRTSGSASAACRSCCRAFIRPAKDRAGTAIAASWPSSTRSACAGFSRRCSTSRSSSARTAFARCRAFTSSTRTCFTCGRQRIPRGLPAGRIRQRHVRRQLELAGPDLDADERAAHPRAAAVLHVLRRRLHGGVSRPARAAG